MQINTDLSKKLAVNCGELAWLYKIGGMPYKVGCKRCM
jgi:hypothetical protein